MIFKRLLRAIGLVTYEEHLDVVSVFRHSARQLHDDLMDERAYSAMLEEKLRRCTCGAGAKTGVRFGYRR